MIISIPDLCTLTYLKWIKIFQKSDDNDQMFISDEKDDRPKN